MRCRLIFTFALMGALTLSCKKDKPEETPPVQKPEEKINTIPEFYISALKADYGKTNPDFKIIASTSNKVAVPQDLDFNRTRADELWVINKGTEASGGSTVIIFNAGKDNQTSELRKDGNAWHFMSLPSAISFSNNGNFGTSSGVKDANHSGGTYAGPALWSSNLDIYARPSGANGSHLDMLHGSPYSMGIDNDTNNAFWVVDGYNNHIVYYNFGYDHGPGMDDHSDGVIHRYPEVSVKRSATAPSHMVLDKKTGWLYIADAGNKRVIRMDVKSGAMADDLGNVNEQLAEHWEMSGVKWEVFANTGFSEPSGIELKDGRLFISDNATGDIIAYSLEDKKEIGRLKTGNAGVTGLKVSPDGKLWYVNQKTNQVIRIDPK